VRLNPTSLRRRHKAHNYENGKAHNLFEKAEHFVVGEVEVVVGVILLDQSQDPRGILLPTARVKDLKVDRFES